MSNPQPQILPRTVAFAVEPCRCTTRHVPAPLECEKHHILPQAVQLTLWGRLRQPQTVTLCRSTHRNVHIYLDALLAGKPLPRVNRYTKQYAVVGYNAIKVAYTEAGKPLPTDGRGE